MGSLKILCKDHVNVCVCVCVWRKKEGDKDKEDKFYYRGWNVVKQDFFWEKKKLNAKIGIKRWCGEK